MARRLEEGRRPARTGPRPFDPQVEEYQIVAPIAGGWPAGHGAGRHGGLVALVPWAASRGGARAPTPERPWRRTWDHLPKRSAGLDFTRADYAAARSRAREVARATLGEALWAQLQHQGLSRRALHAPTRPDVSAARRAAHRGTAVRQGYARPGLHLSVNPTYPLPRRSSLPTSISTCATARTSCTPCAPAVGSTLGRTF